MQWSELFDGNNQLTDAHIREFIASPLWDELNEFLQRTYGVMPELSYSGCSMQSGWNVKYKKGGKSLCTLYPMQGYFIALVVVGKKEATEADLLIHSCDTYTQGLYKQSPSSAMGRWLMIEVTSESILNDVKSLIALRTGVKSNV